MLPLQPPDAVQDVALVLDQVRVLDSPLVTDVGFALSDTVGATASDVVLAFKVALWADSLPALS